MPNGQVIPTPPTLAAPLAPSAIPSPQLPQVPGMAPPSAAVTIPEELPETIFSPPIAPTGLGETPALLAPEPVAPLIPGLAPSPDLLTPTPAAVGAPPAEAPIPVPLAPRITEATDVLLSRLPGLGLLRAPDTGELGEFPPELVQPPTFDASLRAVSELSDETEQLRLRGRDLAISLGTETDPDKQAQLQQELLDNRRAQQLAGAELAAARGVADEEQAIQAQRTEDELRKRQRDAMLAHRKDVQRQAVLDQAADDKLRERQDVARAEHRRRQQRHAEITARGPQRPFVESAVSMLTEALRAYNENRPPNFERVIDGLNKRTEAQWRQELQGAAAQVEVSGDDIADLARQRQTIKLQAAARDAANADRLLLELDQHIANAQDEQTRQSAILARDHVRRQRDAANAAADAELVKSAQAQARADMENQLLLAKIGTERARGAKAQAEAAKLERRGRGGPGRGEALALGQYPPELRALAASGKEGKKSADFQFARLVIDPITKQPLRRSDGTFAIHPSASEAQKLTADLARFAKVNRLINQALAIRGDEGWQPTTRWLSTEAGARMQGLSTELILMNAQATGGGQLTEGDIVFYEKLQGGDLAGLQDPRPRLRDLQKSIVDAINDRLPLGAQPIRFPTVTDPPETTVESLTTFLDQPPALETGDVPSARSRTSAASELLERLIQKHGGDVAAASADFEARGGRSLKKNEAHLRKLEEAWDDAVPDNWPALQRELVEAAFDRETLDESTASGEAINQADARLARARQQVESSLSPRAKRLRAGLREQRHFNENLRAQIAGEARKRAQSVQLVKERRERAKLAVEAFEVGNVPAGARGAF